MGYSNAIRVFEDWGHLGHREGRMLAYMALCTDDRHEVPVYWAGWAKAVAALGIDPLLKTGSGKKVFQQNIAKLRKAGAIVSSGTAGHGQNAVYALTLDPALTAQADIAGSNNGHLVINWTVVPRPDRGNESFPLNGNESFPLRGNESFPNGGTEHTPLKKPINTLKNGQTTPTQATTLLGAVDKTEEDKNLEYQSALNHLMRNPNHQHYMDKAAEELPAEVNSHTKVTHAAALAGWVGIAS